jgi:hypothetical protein
MSTEITAFPTPDTDLLRGAALGMAQGIANTHPGRDVTVGCTCGQQSQTVTEYCFDERGRLDERVLWALVEVLEHVIDRGPRHTLTTLVVA